MSVLITPLADSLPPEAATQEKPAAVVMLANGQTLPLAGLTAEQLHELQWEQEQRFAKAILAYPKRSPERAMIVAQAYDTICAILAAQRDDDGPLTMGLDERYKRMVMQLLDKQFDCDFARPALFEIGFGSGGLLEEVSGNGYRAGGIEVSATMRDQAVQVLGEKRADNLLLGDLRDFQLDDLPFRPSIVYWNDVLEHLAPDEADDYIACIYAMLPPGGTLVTITPNWVLRPSDVTGDFCPLRTEACGLHLKEYRLKEVATLLRRGGFRRVATPLFATHGRLVVCGGGGRWFKQLLEPSLERLPVRLAHLLCRGFAMSITLATK